MDESHSSSLQAGAPEPASTWLSATAKVIAVLATLIALVVAGFVYIAQQQATLGDVRQTARETRSARQAAMEANAAVLNSMVRPGERLETAPYFAALARIDAHPAQDWPNEVARNGGSMPGREVVEELKAAWGQILRKVEVGEPVDAQAAYVAHEVQPKMLALNDAFAARLDGLEAAFVGVLKARDLATYAVVALQILTGLVCILAFLFAERRRARESAARAMAISAANASREQVTRLFQMTDMLQSAADHPDANAVLKAAAAELIPGLGGALYVFNNSRDRLTLSTCWGLDPKAELPETIGLQQCWALKRGKPHVNDPATHKLRCEHHAGPQACLEIPMIARGEILGLLQIFAEGAGAGAAARLDAVAGLGSALADSMSLALANIALRDKLRSQALRDPLTGLYNRRYMEDTLQRVVRLAERERQDVSVIMIDLDHFKRLNDQHGHSKGDAVLRDSAAAVVNQLRETDVACRYGGEELIVVLPNCGIEIAAQKAERIRQSIEALSEPNGAQVSASFGVSTFPTTATGMKDLVANADAALYRAKQEGRNRVLRAASRENPQADAARSEEALDAEMKRVEAA